MCTVHTQKGAGNVGGLCADGSGASVPTREDEKKDSASRESLLMIPGFHGQSMNLNAMHTLENERNGIFQT